MKTARSFLIWVMLGLAVSVPVIAVSFSPLLAYRDPIYITACFAGVTGFALLFLQPLLAGHYLPGISNMRARQTHRIIGTTVVALVIIHIAGLWITSPPDVIDALLFRSPTPFSLWGAIAMWAVFATACLAAFKQKFRLRPRNWRYAHIALAVIIVGSTVAHALQIDGTMELYSKFTLCVLTGLATALLVRRVFWSKA